MKKPLNKLVSEVTKKEGRKVSIGVGQTREVLAILKEMSKDAKKFKTLVSYLLSE